MHLCLIASDPAACDETTVNIAAMLTTTTMHVTAAVSRYTINICKTSIYKTIVVKSWSQSSETDMSYLCECELSEWCPENQKIPSTCHGSTPGGRPPNDMTLYRYLR